MTPGTAPRYGGFWIRAVAFQIDTAFFVVFGFLLALTGIPQGMVFAITVPFACLIIVLCWFYWQTTPGKMLFSAKIVDASSGAAPSLGQCVLRLLSYIPSSVLCNLGFLWIAFDPRKQGWHDKLASTLVLREKKKTAQPRQAALPPPKTHGARDPCSGAEGAPGALQ